MSYLGGEDSSLNINLIYVLYRPCTQEGNICNIDCKPSLEARCGIYHWYHSTVQEVLDSGAN